MPDEVTDRDADRWAVATSASCHPQSPLLRLSSGGSHCQTSKRERSAGHLARNSRAGDDEMVNDVGSVAGDDAQSAPAVAGFSVSRIHGTRSGAARWAMH